MENTENIKKKNTKKKKKNNYDPKWKAKKEVKNSTKVNDSKVEDDNLKKNVVSKREGKKVDKDRLISKYNIEKTMIFKMPPIQEINEDALNKQEDNKDVTSKSLDKLYYGFKMRICTLIGVIILFLVLCIVFMFKAFDYKTGGSVNYSEYTTNSYRVCTKSVDIYYDNCVEKDLEYIANIVDNIHTTFNYEALYSSNTVFNTSYYVALQLRIYDKEDKSRVRYSKEENIIDVTPISVSGEVINFSADADVDFVKYREFVNDYDLKTGVSSGAELEVSLYLESDDISRKVSYITIPLTDDAFMISSSNLENENQIVISNKKIRTVDSMYIFIAVVCFLMDLLVVAYLVNFIYFVTSYDSKYNKELKKILKEYDKIIVNATSRYVIGDDYKIIEVESFKELVDARNSLEKPIVYEKINNIKSKFYVEDDKTVYVFSMKDK